ncbi:HEAT repeat domain-containing protein [Deinococcus multiflagellatus]|uniref:HEAT repeat domain-containing protein n=1 Tax=Deinococcus multiflagellatus TaxID=1656887 RepID=UPI001CC92BCE|nr:HEAT repeat domain-containing protein [Deinococcus multiflagellatus]MBZ9711821.1 hypothetical protein [Deinococcus multiflagellatus]
MAAPFTQVLTLGLPVGVVQGEWGVLRPPDDFVPVKIGLLPNMVTLLEGDPAGFHDDLQARLRAAALPEALAATYPLVPTLRLGLQWGAAYWEEHALRWTEHCQFAGQLNAELRALAQTGKTQRVRHWAQRLVRTAERNHQIASAQEFLDLRNGTDPELYQRAAHGRASPEVWTAVMALDPEMKFWVARNKTVPPEVLTRLSSDPDPRVRWMVATRRACPPETLAQLANDPDESVRLRVAYNAKCPPALLVRLASDTEPEVARVARSRLKAQA